MGVSRDSPSPSDAFDGLSVAKTGSERESVETEGDALLRFSAPDASDRIVRVVTPA